MSIIFDQQLSDAAEGKALDVLSKVLTMLGDQKAHKQRLDQLRDEKASLGDVKDDLAKLQTARLEHDQRENAIAAAQQKVDAAMTDIKARYAALEKTRQEQERRQVELMKSETAAKDDLADRKAKVDAARDAVTTREIELSRREKQALAGV